MEENSGGNHFDNILFWGVIALVVFQLLVGLPDALQRRLGFGAGLFSFVEKTINAPGALKSGSSEYIPLGTRIITTSSKTVWSDAGGGSEIGGAKSGTRATIIDGPAPIEEINWWKFRFENEGEGWMSGEFISIDYEFDFTSIKEDTMLGSKVETLRDIDVLSSPDPSNSVVEHVDMEEKGTLIDGFIVIGSERLWKVRFEKEATGWVYERDIKIDISSDRFALKDNTISGTPVLSVLNVKVLNEPAGEILVGEVLADTRGSVFGGPVMRGDVRWFQINFESEVSGWVNDKSIIRNNIPARVGSKLLKIYKRLALFLSLFLIIGIIYSIVRISQIRSEEKEALSKKIAKAQTLVTDPTNERWKGILEYLNSSNETDWRLAIIEADIMLDEMMGKMGYVGETLGEKLQSVEKSDFTTIEKAWEAHKVRNVVAHKGSAYTLSQREARRVVSLYEEVFKEFRFI